MAGRIFSKDYYVHRQAEFIRALEGGRIAEAVDILEGFPRGKGDVDGRIQGTLTLVEGYRALFEKARGIIDLDSDSLNRYLKAGTLGDFEAYKKLGTPEEIRTAMERLRGYEELGGLEEVTKSLEELDGFKELGSFEEVEGSVAEMHRLSSSLDDLDRL